MAEDGDPVTDLWADWLLGARHAGDERQRRQIQGRVDGYIERLLDLAELESVSTFIDLGSGEGAVAFAGLSRNPTASCVVTDVSQKLLEVASGRARELGAESRCDFRKLAADDLNGIPDGSTDLVTSRSVLAYVADKPKAFSELLRVLRPGGRISIAEPIFEDDAVEADLLRMQVGAVRNPDPLLVLIHRWKAAQFPDEISARLNNPLTNYNERDLASLVLEAGFSEIHVELHVDIRQVDAVSWDAFIGTAPHPMAPSLKEVMERSFSPDEREFFERRMRPEVESRKHRYTDRIAFLTAIKPR